MLNVTVIGQGPYVEKRDIQTSDGVHDLCKLCISIFSWHGIDIFHFMQCHGHGYEAASALALRPKFQLQLRAFKNSRLQLQLCDL